MNIAVIGATGSTGLEFVHQALKNNHCVTVLARSPEKMTVKHPNLKIIQGNVLNPEDVRAVVRGQDAIFIALGTGGTPKKSTIRSDGTAQVIKALEASAERPLIVALSSLGVAESNQQMPFYWQVPLNILLAYAFADHRQQEKNLRDSDLPYVIIRPTFMNDDPEIRPLNAVQAPERVSVRPAISRADVAAFALSAIEERQYNRVALALIKQE